MISFSPNGQVVGGISSANVDRSIPPSIDAHCHLADPHFESNLDQYVKDAKSTGIASFIQGGVNQIDWQIQLDLRRRYPGQIHLCFGWHPWWVSQNYDLTPHIDADMSTLAQWVAQHQNEVVAMGELGLDYSSRFPPSSFGAQSIYFRKQLELANVFQKPVVLHLVKAHHEAFKNLSETNLKPRRGGIVHSFSGTLAQAKSYLDLGLTISIGPGVLRKGFGNLKQTVVSLTSEEFVVESDAPQPRWQQQITLIDVATEVARLRNTTVGKILSDSNQNIKRIFQLSEGLQNQ